MTSYPAHVVVDMLYDFIDGTLACENAANAVKKSTAYANANPMHKMFYVCDCHPANHCSFKENGGEWPMHCVEGTHGAEIHKGYGRLANAQNRPDKKRNVFLKGLDPGKEQYSGFEGIDAGGRTLEAALAENGGGEKGIVEVSGVATEFCIKETCLDLLKAGFKVILLVDAIGYVNKENHFKTIAELQEKGVITKLAEPEKKGKGR
ncbi:MAG: isochorismatase family protein [Bacteroidales bacterium]|jgi:nicotinamidase-related amidase|nr:isochorismatase family protein [Bacteroidales bacterium]MCI2122354.1 isochorismatase family protein [Bacteroidales bacterium]MCI2146092.1 isochorismatase family protein [Bacteroidales bacterium]